ncbi:MAG: sugar ABC transporter permease [Chloroflexi bacterium]|nr:MAG: sugar ABC transporter permease [Chloroflexota bacterium]
MEKKTPSRRRKPFPTHIIVFLAPATIIYTVFMIYPLLDSLRLSLYAPAASGGEMFVGLQNYITLLTDELWSPRFWGALRHNFVFFAIHILVQNPVGLLLAALLSSRRLRWRATYRTLLFTPTMLSFVIVGFIWQLILSPLWGIAGTILHTVGMGQFFKPWLGLESTALVTLSLISVWQFVGIPMMLFYAALLAIPDELIEAAYVDGATGWTVFWRIKFPLILPTVGIVTILTYVGNFNAFDLIYTTQSALAGPNFSTDILGTFFYRTFFGFQLQLGNPTMGATIAGMMFLIILLGVLLYLFGWQRRIQVYEI